MSIQNPVRKKSRMHIGMQCAYPGCLKRNAKRGIKNILKVSCLNVQMTASHMLYMRCKTHILALTEGSVYSLALSGLAPSMLSMMRYLVAQKNELFLNSRRI